MKGQGCFINKCYIIGLWSFGQWDMIINMMGIQAPQLIVQTLHKGSIILILFLRPG